jgi:hypothetical protein
MTTTEIDEKDLTSLFIAADCASKKAQNYYIRIMGIDLLSMTVAAGLTIYNYQSEESKHLVYIISGLLLFGSLILTIVVLTKKFEDFWYQGRALAESCKTLSWRFMMKSELFEDNVDIQTATEKFANRIQLLSKEFPDLYKILNTYLINKPIITKKMMSIRGLSLQDRKHCYIANRIENEKQWYAGKAEWNKAMYNIWFGIIILGQACSIICIVYLIYNPGSEWNLVGLFTTVAAAGLSWLQLKRHQELKQAYTTAAQELNIIVALSDNITVENDFSKFVLDSENAVSREHTLWLAQRRK